MYTNSEECSRVPFEGRMRRLSNQVIILTKQRFYGMVIIKTGPTTAEGL